MLMENNTNKAKKEQNKMRENTLFIWKVLKFSFKEDYKKFWSHTCSKLSVL